MPGCWHEGIVYMYHTAMMITSNNSDGSHCSCFMCFPPTQASVVFFSYMDNLLLLTHDIIVERAYSEFFDWNVIFPLTLQSTFVTIRFIFRSTSIALSEKKTKRYNISNWFCNGSVVSWFMCFAIIYLIRL